MIHEVFQELADQYGPVYTVWLGWTPNVILAKNSVILDAFLEKKNDFAGRFSYRKSLELICKF